MPDEKRPPSSDTVQALFRLAGTELTKEQLEAALIDFTEQAALISKLSAVEVGEAEPVFFLPTDAESR